MEKNGWMAWRTIPEPNIETPRESSPSLIFTVLGQRHFL